MNLLSEYTHLLVAFGASVSKLLLFLVTHYDLLPWLLHCPCVNDTPCLLILVLDYLVPSRSDRGSDFRVPGDTTASLGHARLLT